MRIHRAARHKAFEHSQHLLRGAVGRFLALRRRKLVSQTRGARKPTLEIDEVAEARRNLQRVLNQARAGVAREDYEEYLTYYYETVRPLSLEGGGGHFDYLEGSIDIPELDLESELDWIVRRIGFEADMVQRHLKALEGIDQEILRGDLRAALTSLNETTDTLGNSIWSVQLRLALEHATEGLEAQKRFFEEIRRRHRTGVLPYVVYQTSVRNEDRTTLAKFNENVGKRHEKLKPQPLARYLQMKLTGAWPDTAPTIADVLRIEQARSIVDMYETVVALGQECIRRRDLTWLRPTIANAIDTLRLPDPRLEKLRLQFGLPLLSQLESRAAAVGDYILVGDLRRSVLRSRHEVRLRRDVWALIYQSAALAHRSGSDRPNPSVGEALSQVLSRSSHSGVASSQLLKASFNLAGAPSMRAIYDLGNQLTTTAGDEPFRFSLASLNCALLGPEDISDEQPIPTEQMRAAYGASASLSFWTNGVCKADVNLHADVQTFGEAVASERDGRLDDAIRIIAPNVRGCESAPLRRLSAILLLRCLAFSAASQDIIKFIASEAARPEFSLDSLPVVDALRNIPFSEFRKLQGSIEPLIALDVLQRATDNDAVRSQLRFATKTFLQSTNGKRPSMLLEVDGPFDHGQLIYFLRYVCVQNVIDMSGLFKSSDEVAEERQAICAVLNGLDPLNSEIYEAEILAIEHQRTISAGLEIVNKNRIHVDTDMIASTFERDFAEQFARYHDLTHAGIGVSNDFDEVIRELLGAAKSGKQLFAPENEADATLVQLVANVIDGFLHNATHGLDYFLSKRIRHQSFIGLARGPLEFEQIITTKETATSDYRENEFWLARLQTLDEQRRAHVDAAFRSFAEAFDKLVFDLKDRLFHVRSAERPDGIFYIPMTSNALYLVRAVVKDVVSASEFAGALCEILWVQLEPRLKEARMEISDGLKMKVATLMDNLKLDLTDLAAGDPALADLQLAIGRASAAVQTALGDAEAWFNRPQVAGARRLFELRDAVEVAIESARKLHRAFEPQITVTTSDDFMLQAGDLVFLTDAVFIAFSNIRTYSGSKSPRVAVTCTVDAVEETLILEIVNEVLPRMRSKDQDRHLEEIRSTIARGTGGKRMKREGGSGFLKLSAVTSQSKKGDLQFGYMGDDQFRLAVTWSFILARS